MTATRMGIVRSLMTLVLFGGVVLGAARPALAGGDWNDSGVKWRSYDDGLAEAKKEKKPVMSDLLHRVVPALRQLQQGLPRPEGGGEDRRTSS